MDAAPDGAVRWTDGVVWLENWITVGRDSSTGAEGNFSRTARKDMSTAFHLTRHISPDAFSQFSQVAKSIIHVSQPVTSINVQLVTQLGKWDTLFCQCSSHLHLHLQHPSEPPLLNHMLLSAIQKQRDMPINEYQFHK